MSKTRSWLAFAMAASLFLGTLAPTAALAYRSDRPTDLLDDPPLQYGDPDPGGGGSPMLWDYLAFWRQIIVASMRIQFSLPVDPVRNSRPTSDLSTVQVSRGSPL